MRKIVGGTWRRIISCFLAGAFAILPIVITVAAVAWVAGFVSTIIGPNTVLGGVLRSLGLQFAGNETVAYTLGWLLVLAAVFGLGVLMESGLRNLLQKLIDAAMSRVPVLSGVYSMSKQVVDLLDKKKGEANLQGMSAVFCFFGQDRGTALLALLVSPDRYHIEGRDYVIVIIPTAPVPIGGGLLFVPADSIRPADVSMDGLMSIYVSMGASASQYLGKPESK